MSKNLPVMKFSISATLFLTFFLGVSYAILLVADHDKDTSLITNTAFAMIATLAGLSFSFARVVAEEETRDRVMFAGERFLHGAILILVSSVVKYFVFLAYYSTFLANFPWVMLVIRFSFAAIVAGIFLNGVVFAHTGLRVLNSILFKRIMRHSDWNDVF